MRTLEIPSLEGSSLTSQIEIGDSLGIVDADALSSTEFVPRPCVWRILTPGDGDKRVVWNPDSFTEIREASDLFKKLIAAGMMPYVCDAQGKPTGEVMDVFDPGAGEVSFQDVLWAPKKLAVGG